MRFVGYTTVGQNLVPKVLQDKDLAIQDLLNHFNTRKGERVMDPEFGSIIPLMIFEPLDEISTTIIREDAERIVGLDPRWEVVDFALTETDQTVTLQIRLKYLNKSEEEVFVAYERDVA